MVQLLLHDAGVFWKFMFRCFFSELGGKTFFVVALLAAWVATWEGVCVGRQQRQHQLMVLAGTLTALLLHAILVIFHAISSWGSSVFNFTGAALFAAMGTKLHLELQKAQLGVAEKLGDKMSEEKDETATVWNPLAPQIQPQWNSMAFRAQPNTASQAAAPADRSQGAAGVPAQTYGSMPTPPSSVPEWAKEIPKPVGQEAVNVRTLLFAGFLTMVLVFVVAVGDRSQYSFLQPGETRSASLVVSSMLGYILATCLAVLVGYFMESILHPDVWVLFAAKLGFFALGIICFSQAVLGLSPLSLRNAATALLAFAH